MSSVRRSRRRADHARELDTALVVGEAPATEIAAAPPQGQRPTVQATRRAKTIKRGAHVAMAPVRWTTEFAEGVRLYWRGFRMWGANPRLMLVGVVPGILTAILFGALFAAQFAWLDEAAEWASARITDNSFFGDFIAAVIAFAVFTGSVVLAVYAFVSVASVIGQPFFEKLSHSVDDKLGQVPDGPEWPWWRNALRGIGEGLRLFLVQAPISISIFLIGLIPIVGTVTSWILGALVGGWFVALEMTSIPFERRGYVLRDRRRALGDRRARTLGFGVMAFMMAIVPPLAALTMPAGVAAGTVLARRSLGEDAGAPARRRTVPEIAETQG